jgi:two-component system capsular synthesis sensor histidine kinase RcsC
MPSGMCPNCGKVFKGWALLSGDKKCDCGYTLDVREETHPSINSGCPKLVEGQSNNKKILVADDDALNRKLLDTFLTFCGYTVDCVTNGGDALTSIKRGDYDILITDYIMPEIDGIELTKRVRDLNLSLPIIGISSSDNEKAFLAAGANLFMAKPISLSVLGNALERELLI